MSLFNRMNVQNVIIKWDRLNQYYENIDKKPISSLYNFRMIDKSGFIIGLFINQFDPFRFGNMSQYNESY